jgi:TonB family protein
MKPTFACIISILAIPVFAQNNRAPAKSALPMHTARLGDLQTSVTAARIASSQDIAEYGLHPRAGYNVALVFLRVKNAAQYPACASLDEWLVVKEGYVYPDFVTFGGRLKPPQMSGLLPTDESSGVFAFEIKAGTSPDSLKLVRGTVAENVCVQFQHRETPVIGPESVRLPLSGLPLSLGPLQDLRPQLTQEQLAPPELPAKELPPVPVLTPSQSKSDVEAVPNEPVITQNDGRPVFRPGQKGITYPSCLYCPEPQYTSEARAAKIEGVVSLQVIIQPDGHATNIQIVKGIGHGLDERAVEAVRRWRFKPAIGPNGMPVATITPILVNFKLLF